MNVNDYKELIKCAAENAAGLILLAGFVAFLVRLFTGSNNE